MKKIVYFNRLSPSCRIKLNHLFALDLSTFHECGGREYIYVTLCNGYDITFSMKQSINDAAFLIDFDYWINHCFQHQLSGKAETLFESFINLFPVLVNFRQVSLFLSTIHWHIFLSCLLWLRRMYKLFNSMRIRRTVNDSWPSLVLIVFLLILRTILNEE